AQDLLDRLGPPRTSLDCGIVGNYNNFPALDFAHDSHDARARSAAIVLIVSDEQSDLLHVSIFIEQQLDAFASGEFSLLMLAFDFVRPTTEPQLGFKSLE